jgi:xylose dehydrogenase (NAD/NADP)
MMHGNPSPPVRLGILGAASVARNFVRAVSCSDKIRIVTVASRDKARAERFAQEFGLSRHSASYEDLLSDPEIDAVYNPLPNSLHAEWSIRAARAGKHVLCEKPFSASVEEARSMVRVAHEASIYLVEAFPYRSQPLTFKMQDCLACGEIGSVDLIQASFEVPLTDESDIRFNPKLKGGALWDLGCYPISLVTMIAGELPKRVHASLDWAITGVDKAATATLEFATGLVAQISCSFGTGLHRHATICGSKGIIQTEYLNHTLPKRAIFQIKRGVNWGAPFEAVEAPATNGFLAEAESFAGLVRHGPMWWNGASNKESINIILILEAIYASAQRGKPVEIMA